MLLRCTSVGWAVSTGTISASAKNAASAAGPMPAVARAVERVRQAALARRGAGDLVGARAADVVLVLGDVGEVREVAEGPHHDHGLVGASAGRAMASSSARAAASSSRWKRIELRRMRSMSLEGLRALLLAHGVAEQAAEQADVLAQRQVLVVVVGQAVALGWDGADSR